MESFEGSKEASVLDARVQWQPLDSWEKEWQEGRRFGQLSSK